jgi:hypothetical protein
MLAEDCYSCKRNTNSTAHKKQSRIIVVTNLKEESVRSTKYEKM